MEELKLKFKTFENLKFRIRILSRTFVMHLSPALLSAVGWEVKEKKEGGALENTI